MTALKPEAKVLGKLIDSGYGNDANTLVGKQLFDEPMAPVVVHGFIFGNRRELALRQPSTDAVSGISQRLELRKVPAERKRVQKAAGAVPVAVIQLQRIAGLGKFLDPDIAFELRHPPP